MKRQIAIAILVAVLLCVFKAFAGVEKTKHNLSYKHQKEVCTWCHTPHSADAESIGPQIRSSATKPAAYTIYGASIAGITVDSTPNTLSKACLSCHDGIQAYNLNIEERKEIKSVPLTSGTIQLVEDTGSSRNHHAVPVVYNDRSKHLKPAGSALTGWIGGKTISDLLRNGRVECSSCHDPHISDNPLFLRHGERSTFCYGCHGWR